MWAIGKLDVSNMTTVLSTKMLQQVSHCLQRPSQSCTCAQDARLIKLIQDQQFDIDLDKALRVVVGLKGCDTWAIFEAMMCSIFSHIFLLDLWGSSPVQGMLFSG